MSQLREWRIYDGWLVVAACFVLSTVTYGTVFSFSVFFESIAADVEVSRATVSLLFSVQLFVLYASAPLTGLLIDRYGRRRVLAGGSLLLSGGLVGVSQANSFVEMVVTYGVIAGLGLGATYVVAFSTVPHYFTARRGLANGFATAGSGMGILCLPPLSSYLIDAIGWQSTFLSFGLGFVFLLALALLAIGDGSASTRSNPTPDGSGLATDADGSGSTFAKIKRLVATPPFLLLYFGIFCMYVPLYTLNVHLVPLIDRSEMARWVGVWALSLVGVTSIGSRILVGQLSDTLGRVPSFLLSAVLMGGAVVALPFVVRPEVVFLAAILFGTGQGGSASLLAPIAGDFFGDDRMSLSFGLLSTTFAFAGSLVPYASGLAFDAFGTYTVAFVASGLVGVGSFGVVYLAWHLVETRPVRGPSSGDN